jgi:hypothetical protein
MEEETVTVLQRECFPTIVYKPLSRYGLDTLPPGYVIGRIDAPRPSVAWQTNARSPPGASYPLLDRHWDNWSPEDNE